MAHHSSRVTKRTQKGPIRKKGKNKSNDSSSSRFSSNTLPNENVGEGSNSSSVSPRNGQTNALRTSSASSSSSASPRNGQTFFFRTPPGGCRSSNASPRLTNTFNAAPRSNNNIFNASYRSVRNNIFGDWLPEDNFDPTPQAELVLLNALRGLRPIGVYYPLIMTLIHERFTRGIGLQVTIEELNRKLSIYSNLEEAMRMNGEDFSPYQQNEFSPPLIEFPKVAALMAWEAEKRRLR